MLEPSRERQRLDQTLTRVEADAPVFTGRQRLVVADQQHLGRRLGIVQQADGLDNAGLAPAGGC